VGVLANGGCYVNLSGTEIRPSLHDHCSFI
jgi:hypothetical protein